MILAQLDLALEWIQQRLTLEPEYLALCLLAGGVFIKWWRSRARSRHAPRIRMASKVLRKLQKLGEASGPGSQMAYLRSKAVDPFVFEEAILTALRERGLRIRRNKRYTGDGGIDGNAWIGKQRVLIQAKLYTNHIAPADVREFARLCQRHRAMGLFVHSGRTGPASRKQLTDELDIVSGERLLQLLCGDPLRLFPQRTPSDAKRKGRQ